MKFENFDKEPLQGFEHTEYAEGIADLTQALVDKYSLDDIKDKLIKFDDERFFIVRHTQPAHDEQPDPSQLITWVDYLHLDSRRDTTTQWSFMIDSDFKPWTYERSISNQKVLDAIRSYDVGSREELLDMLQIDTDVIHNEPNQFDINSIDLSAPSTSSLIYLENMMRELCIKMDAIPSIDKTDNHLQHESLDKKHEILSEVAQSARLLADNPDTSDRYLSVESDDPLTAAQIRISTIKPDKDNTQSERPTIRLDFFEEVFDELKISADEQESDGYLLYRCYKIGSDNSINVHQNDIDIIDYEKILKQFENNLDMFRQIQLGDDIARLDFIGDQVLFDQASIVEVKEILESLNRIQNNYGL